MVMVRVMAVGRMEPQVVLLEREFPMAIEEKLRDSQEFSKQAGESSLELW
jgi:hypothetical protein